MRRIIGILLAIMIVGGIAYAINLERNVVVSKYSFVAKPYDVVIFEDEKGTIYAVDRYGQIIYNGTNVTEALNTALKDYNVVYIKEGHYVGGGKVNISMDKPIYIIGEEKGYFQGGSGVLLDNVCFYSNRTTWSAEPVVFENINIRHDKCVAIFGQYRLVYLEHVGFINLRPDLYKSFISTASGPPGKTVIWRDVTFYAKPSTALTNWGYLADIHYENFGIYGLTIVLDNDYSTSYGYKAFILRGVGAYSLSNINIFYGFKNTTGGVYLFILQNSGMWYRFTDLHSNVISTGYVAPANIIVFDSVYEAQHVIVENAKLYGTEKLFNPERSWLIPRDTILENVYLDNNKVMLENHGYAKFTADGTATKFYIAHGLYVEPNYVSITPLNGTAMPDKISYNNTHIILEYNTAPANGTVLEFSWEARR